MITLQNAQNALKTVYLEALSNQLNTQVDPVFNMIKQSSADVYGKNIIKLVPYGINGGIGAGDEDGALPVGDSTRYLNFNTTLKNLYGAIEISDKAIRASENDEGAFVNLLTAEMEGLLNSSKFNLGRMFYGDGSGRLVKSITAIDTAAKTMQVPNTSSFMEGMLLDFYLDNVMDADMMGVEVLKIDRNNKIIYLDKVSTSFATKNIAKYTVCVQGSKDRELTGLGAIFSNSETLYGINRANNTAIMPTIAQKLNDKPISQINIQEYIDDVEMRSNYTPNVILCGGNLMYDLITLFSTNIRNLDTTNSKAGVSAVTYCGIPVLRNRFESERNMMLLNTDQFTLHQLCDWEWLTHNDGSILKQKEGYATYSATLVKYADLICNRPNAQAIITNL